MAESAAEAAEPTTCPACNAPADGAKRYCACGEDLSVLFAERWANEAEERARREFAEGGVPEIPLDAWRPRHGVRTWIAWTLTPVVAIVIAAVNHVAFPSMLPGNPHLVVGLVGLALLGPAVAWLHSRRAAGVRPPNELRDADATFHTFIHALLQDRSNYAWHLLLPRRRSEDRRGPAIEVLGTRAVTLDFSHPELFRGYWLRVLHPAGSATSLVSIATEPDGDDRAVGRAEFLARRQRSVPLWILLPAVPAAILLGPRFAGSLWIVGPFAGIAPWILMVALEALFPGERTTLVLETRLVRIGGRWFVHDASLVPQLNEA
jgi:hypothetical protein